jgi:hypothetical protein
VSGSRTSTNCAAAEFLNFKENPKFYRNYFSREGRQAPERVFENLRQ